MEEKCGKKLRFLFEPNKNISCKLTLVNKLNPHIAFKITTTHAHLYTLKPNNGVIKPHTEFEVMVTRHAAPLSHWITKGKFFVHSVKVPEDASNEQVASLLSSNGKARIREVGVDIQGIPEVGVEELMSKIEEQDLKLKETQEMISKMESEIKELNLHVTKKDEKTTISEVKKQKSDSGVYINCFNFKWV